MNNIILNQSRRACILILLSMLGCCPDCPDGPLFGGSGGDPVGPTEHRISGSNLAILDLETDSLKFITQKIPSTCDWQPHWYPDGKRILFLSDRQNGGIFNLDIDDTTSIIKLSPDFLSPIEFSSDGSKMLFLNNAYSQPPSVLMNSSNGEAIYLSQWGIIGKARFSPDGAKVIGNGGSGKVIIISCDGSDKVEVQTPLERSEYPLITPDGAKIVFGSSASSSTNPNIELPNIFIIDADGTNLKNLTNFTQYYGSVEVVQLSPDGTTILCKGAIPDGSGRFGAFLMSLDGTNMIVLPNWGQIMRYSEDGSKVGITFCRGYWTDGNGQHTENNITIYDLRGNLLKTIVTSLFDPQLSSDLTKTIGSNYWNEPAP